MRRQRHSHKAFAFLAVTLGVAAVPVAAHATSGDDAGTVADLSADTPSASPSDATDPQPDPAPAEPQRDPEPAPRPQLETDPTTPPTTDPEPATESAPTTQPEPADATLPEPATADRAPVVESDAPAPSTAPSVDVVAPAEQEEPAVVEGIDGITRVISFPVLGPVRYGNDFGACRDACARHHQGNDMIGVRMQPLLAAVDGTVTHVRYESAGTVSAAIRITGDDGWYYGYYHVNNDTPGTDDGRATHEWQVSPGLTVGSRVRAGQVIGYMGDSGNSELSVPHLHFEIRTPDHTPVNPYHSLVAAQRRETCAIDPAWTNTPVEALSPSAVAVIPLADGGRWVIDADGRLHAEGPAARIQPVAGVECSTVDPLPAAAAVAIAPAAPIVAPAAPAAPATAPSAVTADPAPAAAARWTVEAGDSLWRIVQASYDTTDTKATAALVAFVFAHNRDQLTDPSTLAVGMQLELPPILL